MTNKMGLRLPLFVASLWLALATALLSSLIPGGLPRTTVLGSAFHPSTTAVALQPSRAQPRIAVETVRRDDGPASGQGSDIAIDRAASPATFPVAQPAATSFAPFHTINTPSRVVIDGSPRGPPLY